MCFCNFFMISGDLLRTAQDDNPRKGTVWGWGQSYLDVEVNIHVEDCGTLFAARVTNHTNEFSSAHMAFWSGILSLCE